MLTYISGSDILFSVLDPLLNSNSNKKINHYSITCMCVAMKTPTLVLLFSHLFAPNKIKNHYNDYYSNNDKANTTKHSCIVQSNDVIIILLL